ncbi:2,4-dienoyl-CoA reductase-like NADH-dependent reductase (Old Yellow Enzyme family), partial [Clostridium saccharobutylicum]|nr:2,4-dienoyl-CoA reductase-like NADH-dependent reductase (Old Yellow Enzyme family) [Clostridium saccharobutylicum]
TCVNIDGKLSEKQLGIWADDQIEGLKKIVDAVHEENCPIFIQIHHAELLEYQKIHYVQVTMNIKILQKLLLDMK